MFQNKLIKSLQKTQAWTELASALESLNAQVLEPSLDRLKGMTSVFTMHKDDLQVLFNELGSYFAIGKSEEEDIPLLLQQRRDEIHYKGYEYPLKKTFEREFLGIPMNWEPLYAPKDLVAFPYGSKFLLWQDIINESLNPSDYFKTYRAVIFARLDQVEGKMGIDEFERLLNSVAIPLIPTHICFDGQQYYLKAIILGDYLIEPIIQLSSISDTKPKLTLDNIFNASVFKNPDIRDAKPKLITNTNIITTKNLIAIDDFPFDSIPLELNDLQGNWQ